MKILINLLFSLLLVSCCNNKPTYETYKVKFKDGSEIEVKGYDTYLSRNGYGVSNIGGDLIFNKEEVVYIIKLEE